MLPIRFTGFKVSTEPWRDEEQSKMTVEQKVREGFTWSLPPDERSPRKPDQNQDAGNCATPRAEMKFELKLIRRPAGWNPVGYIPSSSFYPPDDNSKGGIEDACGRLLKNIHTESNTSTIQEQKLMSLHGFPIHQEVCPHLPCVRNANSTLGTTVPFHIKSSSNSHFPGKWKHEKWSGNSTPNSKW